MCFLNLNKCCCFGLKTGSLIIGATDLVLGVAGILQVVSTQNTDATLGYIQKICAILGTVAAVFLLIGVQKEYHRFILFWIVVKIINMFAIVIVFVTFAAELLTAKPDKIQDQVRAMFVVYLILSVVTFALQFYCLLIVTSYKREIKMKSFIQNNVSTA